MPLMGFRPKDDPGVVAAVPATVYTLRTLAEVNQLLLESGFTESRCDVQTDRGRQIAWATARAGPHAKTDASA